MAGERIVLLARHGESTRLLYHALAARFDAQVVLEQPPSALALLRARARRMGWPQVLGQLLFLLLVAKPMAIRSRGRRARIAQEHGCSIAALPQQAVARVGSVNTQACWDAVRALQPRAVVINGTRILSKRAIAELGAPILNTHVGITPLYRGVHGAYWALAQGDPEHCGVTVHLVDAGVDTGAILHQATVRPTREDDFTTYPTLQMAVGAKLLVKAVQEVLDGTAAPRAATGESRRWNHPTLWAYLRNRVLKGVR